MSEQRAVESLVWAIPTPSKQTTNPKCGPLFAKATWVSLGILCVGIAGLVLTQATTLWSIVAIVAAVSFCVSALLWAGYRVVLYGIVTLTGDAVSWCYKRASCKPPRQYCFPREQLHGYTLRIATGDHMYTGYQEIVFHLSRGWQTHPLVIDPRVSVEQLRNFCNDTMHLLEITDETAETVAAFRYNWLWQKIDRKSGLLCSTFAVPPTKRDNGLWHLFSVPELGEILGRPRTNQVFLLDDQGGRTPLRSSGELAERIAARSDRVSGEAMREHVQAQLDRHDYEARLPKGPPFERYARLLAEEMTPYVTNPPAIKSVRIENPHGSRIWLFADVDDGVCPLSFHLDATWSPVTSRFRSVHLATSTIEGVERGEAAVVAAAREGGFFVECDGDYVTWIFEGSEKGLANLVTHIRTVADLQPGPPGTQFPKLSLVELTCGLDEEPWIGWEGIFGPASALQELADTIAASLAGTPVGSEFGVDGWDTNKEWQLRFVVKGADYDPAKHGRYV